MTDAHQQRALTSASFSSSTLDFFHTSIRHDLLWLFSCFLLQIFVFASSLGQCRVIIVHQCDCSSFRLPLVCFHFLLLCLSHFIIIIFYY